MVADPESDTNGDDTPSWGAVGMGCSKHVSVELLEDCAACSESWRLLVSLPGAQFSFQLPSAQSVSEIECFLRTNFGRTSSRLSVAGECASLPEGVRVYSQVAELTILAPSRFAAAMRNNAVQCSSTLRLAKDGELPDRFCVSMSGPEHSLHLDIHDPVASDLVEAFADLRRDLGK